ncbi:Reverse transcriptase [Acanthamoeba castellanii str. Neff]|uniref:Reverse transcriptase n=1 Tax=Acanthamoeba castellanii (strain ATCC 30010 / Neff) TaxID=1257118 RepID=L8GWM9_ACACF|nr:Reverse transcriptase [Acanthamoeba castellanii str. Neff]ELR17604.1 Reverse transcriptase [Acanthamoeba castellanii str. Neff]
MAAKSVACPHDGCANKYASEASLRRHIKNKHATDEEGDETSHSCPHCHRPFSTARGLSVHIGKSHRQAPPEPTRPPPAPAPADPGLDPDPGPTVTPPSRDDEDREEPDDDPVEIADLSCPHCAQALPSAHGLANHLRACKDHRVPAPGAPRSGPPSSRYWTAVEHHRYVEAMARFADHPDLLARAAAHIGTRTYKQVDSHRTKVIAAEREGRPVRTLDPTMDWRMRPYCASTTARWLAEQGRSPVAPRSPCPEPHAPPPAAALLYIPATPPAPTPRAPVAPPKLAPPAESTVPATPDGNPEAPAPPFSAPGPPTPKALPPPPPSRRNLRPHLVPKDAWQGVADAVAPAASRLLRTPLAHLSTEQWATFEAALAGLEATLHHAARSAEAVPTRCASRAREDAERQLREARKTREIFGKAAALYAAGKDPTATIERIPPEVRLHLPTPGSAEWPARAAAARRVIRRAVARADRLRKRMGILDSDRDLQRLFNANQKKAVRQILAPSTKAPRCQLDPAAVEEAYIQTLAKPPPIDPSPPWKNSVQWPRPPTAADDGGSPFSVAEVRAQLRRLPNGSAPGIDGIPYEAYKRTKLDATLAHVFEVVRLNARLPARWDVARTVLLYKKGDPNDTGNWRPISLQVTIYKIFTAALSKRLISWAGKHNTFSASQKGFLPAEGCHEHAFVLRSVLDDARRHKQNVYLAWYDLRNAFGSVSHDLIAWCAAMLGLPRYLRDAIGAIYRHSALFVQVGDQETTGVIPMRCGVKQGCPLSPLLFNLCVEPALRCLRRTTGYKFYGTSITVEGQAYADDLLTAAPSAYHAARQVATIEEWANWAGVSFVVQALSLDAPAGKCAALAINFEGGLMHSIDPALKVQGAAIPAMSRNNVYRYLGVHVGLTDALGQANELLEKASRDARTICASGLEPWQKVVAIKTFILSRLPFFFHNGKIQRGRCQQFDRELRENLRAALRLPVCTTNAFFHSRVASGGLGILPIAEEQQVYLAAHVFKLLTSPDLSIRAIARHQLAEVTHARHTTPVQDGEASPFFGWLMRGQEVASTTPSGDVSSIWFAAAGAYSRMGWSVRDALHPTLTVGPGVQFEGRFQRANVIPALRASAFSRHAVEWSALRTQGRAAAYQHAVHPATHHWVHNSAGLTTKEYRFAIKCRLGLLPTRAAPHHRNGPTACRACSYARETANHVLGHCPATKAEVIARHNRICRALAQAAEASWTSVLEDVPIPGVDSPLRPDIYCSRPGQCAIIEVAVSYEDAFNASMEGRAKQKTDKYAGLAATVEEQLRLQTRHAAFVVGFSGVPR